MAATTVSGLPLNINLGAYSPALVVGDGEISFGGAEAAGAAEALINTVQGSTAETVTGTAAAGTVATAGKSADGSSIITPAGTEATIPSASKSKRSDGTTDWDGNADIDVREKRNDPIEKRDLAGFSAALNFAAGALTTGPEIRLGTGEGGSGVGITQKPGAAAGGGTKITRELARNLEESS